MTTGERVAEELVDTEQIDEIVWIAVGNLVMSYYPSTESALTTVQLTRKVIAAAIDKAIADHIASVQPVGPEDAAVVEEARELLRKHDNDVSTLWSELLAHIDRQQAVIARLLNDDETGLFDAGREAGRRETWEACAKFVEAGIGDDINTKLEAALLGANSVIAAAIRDRGSKEGKPPAF